MSSHDRQLTREEWLAIEEEIMRAKCNFKFGGGRFDIKPDERENVKVMGLDNVSESENDKINRRNNKHKS